MLERSIALDRLPSLEGTENESDVRYLGFFSVRFAEQARLGAVAGRDGGRPQHLRAGEQVGAAHQLSVVGDPEHQLRRQKVRHQTRRQDGAALRLLLGQAPRQQTGSRPVSFSSFPIFLFFFTDMTRENSLWKSPTLLFATESQEI